ncbi:glycosyltransferase family 9 protein, partial [Desulfovibrio litoralis]
MQKIAVWNTAFLGDAVLTLPLLENLHKAYPEAKIDFWVRKGLSPLFSKIPYINKVYEFDKRGKQKALFSVIPLSREIKKQNYDCWISAHTSLRSGLVALLSKVPKRIGYKQAKTHFIHNLAYTDYVERQFPEVPEIERLNNLLRPLNIEPSELNPNFYLATPNAESLAKFSEGFGFIPSTKSLNRHNVFLSESTSKQTVLGLHPGSTWKTKQWLPEYFAKLAIFALNKGSKTVIFAGPGEEVIANQVNSLILTQLNAEKKYDLTKNILNLAGKLSLTELTECINLLDAYVCNDSGTMHISWSLGTPTFGIFGPTIPEFG